MKLLNMYIENDYILKLVFKKPRFNNYELTIGKVVDNLKARELEYKYLGWKIDTNKNIVFSFRLLDYGKDIKPYMNKEITEEIKSLNRVIKELKKNAKHLENELHEKDLELYKRNCEIDSLNEEIEKLNDYIIRQHLDHPETLFYLGTARIRNMLNNENNK